MKFNCYYRGKDGSRQVVEFDAPDRSEAFYKAKQMGLPIIELVSGGKPTIKSTKKISKPKKTIKKQLDEETIVYKQREHSYILGVLLGPIGFLIASLVWKQRGMKYGMYGLGMAVLVFVLGWIFGIIGSIAGLVSAVLVESFIIPKPYNDKLEWSKL